MEAPSSDIFSQIVTAVIIVGIVFVIYMTVETLIRAYLAFNGSRIVVYPMTGNRMKTFLQDPTSSDPTTMNLPLSENQLTGIEFSYSSFVYIQDTTFSSRSIGDNSWSTLFYKGYSSGPFPLCGPGVFVSSGTTSNPNPVLRVVMNSYAKWFNKVDVHNIPINKWFHLVIVVADNNLSVFINGNLANKSPFTGSLPYQNYQPLNLFPSFRTGTPSDFDNTGSSGDTKRGVPAGDSFVINGPMNGYLSNIIYYTYGISYAEIQGLLNMGPSSQMDTGDLALPPYLIDTWWTQQNSTQ
jgi:hypothetical protein